MARLVEHEDADAETRALFDEIVATRGLQQLPNFYKALASHPPTLRRFWESLKVAMAPGRLDPLTKELVAITVAIMAQSPYVRRSHIAVARRLGMDDAMLGELLSVISAFSDACVLADGFEVPIDPHLQE